MSTQSIYQESLITAVEGTASWRAEKAVEYPEDTRNAASSRALGELREQLEALPADHPKFRALENAYDKAENDTLISLSEAESETLKRYGFYGTEEGGVEAFLDMLLRSDLENADPEQLAKA